MEARLYAEDPAHGYLPSVGTIAHLRWPDAAPGLRLDIGVDAGDEVSTFYDPMLGKIIAWGESRGAAAIDLLRSALEQIEIVGVTTNRALLTSVLADDEFRRGPVATNFLKRSPLAIAVRRTRACRAGYCAGCRVVRDPANRRQRAVGG